MATNERQALNAETLANGMSNEARLFDTAISDLATPRESFADCLEGHVENADIGHHRAVSYFARYPHYLHELLSAYWRECQDIAEVVVGIEIRLIAMYGAGDHAMLGSVLAESMTRYARDDIVRAFDAKLEEVAARRADDNDECGHCGSSCTCLTPAENE